MAKNTNENKLNILVSDLSHIHIFMQSFRPSVKLTNLCNDLYNIFDKELPCKVKAFTHNIKILVLSKT